MKTLLAVTLSAVTSLVVTSLAVTLSAVAMKKLAPRKVAPAKKKSVFVDSSSEESNGYASSKERCGYLLSEETDTKLSVLPQANRGLSEYELLHEMNVAQNKA